MNRRKFMHFMGLSGAVILLSGCTSAGRIESRPVPKGPPPHAPAHGYRRKNRQGLSMMFDSNLGVYVLMDYPMHYFWDDRYYRKGKHGWETTEDINNKWRKIIKHDIPQGLQNK